MNDVKDTKKFVKQFPKITKQEKLSAEVMDAIEGGSCEQSCTQGCAKKNLKNGKKS